MPRCDRTPVMLTSTIPIELVVRPRALGTSTLLRPPGAKRALALAIMSNFDQIGKLLCVILLTFQ